eukprot:TRINITY_DN256_c0_g1_i12.p1 TRINITY_DN256_c0_g1~~TRINITY_DN256_c0_g1_i12.p1  ORF type:complete len:230 (-),score=-30.45 TRINITY_DN256_c0_g1_i12:5-694(-)
MQKARGQAYGLSHNIPPTACRQTVSGTISLPSPGCFSPFPHGTGSLSVVGTYLALPDGPGRFRRGSTCPAVLGCPSGGRNISCTGLSPSMVDLSRSFHYASTLQLLERIRHSQMGPTTPLQQRPYAYIAMVWANPRSLAATWRIVVTFFSSGYLDVSVLPVRLIQLFYSLYDVRLLNLTGFPIRISPDLCLFSDSPKLFAAYHVLLRLLVPRHPPYALYSLATIPCTLR